MQKVLGIIREKDYGGGVTFSRLKGSLKENEQDIYDAIDELIDTGKINEIKKGCFQASDFGSEPEKTEKKVPQQKKPEKNIFEGFFNILKVLGAIFLILIAIPFFYGNPFFLRCLSGNFWTRDPDSFLCG